VLVTVNALREGSLRTTASSGSNHVRQTLVVAEVAISLVLLVGAGLLVQTFKKLSGVSPGFKSAQRNQTLTVSEGLLLAAPRLLETVLSSSIAQQRFMMTLLAILAGMALVLGAIGLYSVTSYSVEQRTRELGIRSALGAGRRELFNLIVGQRMSLAGIGRIIGVLSSLVLTRFLRSMLYGVTSSDPLVMAGVVAMLGSVALFACYLRQTERLASIRSSLSASSSNQAPDASRRWPAQVLC